MKMRKRKILHLFVYNRIQWADVAKDNDVLRASVLTTVGRTHQAVCRQRKLYGDALAIRPYEVNFTGTTLVWNTACNWNNVYNQK